MSQVHGSELYHANGHEIQVRQLEMERFSMSKAVETDKAAASRIKGLDKQLKELKHQQAVRVKSLDGWTALASRV